MDGVGATPVVAERPEGLSEGARRVARSLARPSLHPFTIAMLAASGDAAALSLALWFAQYAVAEPFAPVAAGFWSALGALGGAAAVLALGGYRLRALRRWFDGALTLALSGALALTALWASGAGQGSAGLAESGFLALAAFALPLRAFTAAAIDWAASAGVTERRAVIVGGGEEAARVIRALSSNAENDIRICGMFDDRDDVRSPTLVVGAPKLGRISELVDFARIAEIDMAIITLPLTAERRILQIMQQLWVLPLDIRISASSADCDFSRRWRQAPREAGMIHVMRRPLEGARRIAKRALDLVGAAAALVVLALPMLAVAVAIRLESRGKVIFKQKRHGYNHREVVVWKFRSMYAEQCDAAAVRVVTRGDPRVTRVGAFIRKTSLDELPQLFNVLAGSLSLVGPRPHALVGRASTDQTFEQIVDGYSGRHKVKPGITGWAQIHGWRGEIDDPEKLRRRFEHDLYYIENWSLWLDLKILLRTPLSLLNTRSAY